MARGEREGRRTAPSAIKNFRAPEPKGPKLRRETIPKSVAYEPPEVDPDEEAAFVSPTARARAKTRKLGLGDDLSPAQLRMRGAAAAVASNDEAFDDENLEDDDEGDEARMAAEVDAALTRRQPAAAAHPVSPFPMDTQTTQGPVPATVPTGVVASLTFPELVARPVLVEDIDRLWDWIRADKDQGASFLGRTFTHSIALHEFARQMGQAEMAGLAITRAIHYGPHHLGFAMLAPILAQERTALMHIYLRQDVRGQLAKFTAPLVEIAERVAPGVHLAVASADATWQRLHRSILVPLGFTEHALFVK